MGLYSGELIVGRRFGWLIFVRANFFKLFIYSSIFLFFYLYIYFFFLGGGRGVIIGISFVNILPIHAYTQSRTPTPFKSSLASNFTLEPCTAPVRLQSPLAAEMSCRMYRNRLTMSRYRFNAAKMYSSGEMEYILPPPIMICVSYTRY